MDLNEDTTIGKLAKQTQPVNPEKLKRRHKKIAQHDKEDVFIGKNLGTKKRNTHNRIEIR